MLESSYVFASPRRRLSAVAVVTAGLPERVTASDNKLVDCIAWYCAFTAAITICVSVC
jgi:hypothetical protein